MDKFSTKTALKELMENTDQYQNELNTLKQAMMGIYQKLYQLENASQNARRADNLLDFRTRAITNLLGRLGVSDADVKAEVFTLQVQQFERDSAEDDKKRNLVPANGPAQKGQFAITTIRLFKDGVEVEDERVVRSKVELGKAEFLPEVDEAIYGMQIGDTKTFPLKLGAVVDSAELTLLSLADKAPEANSGQDPQAPAEGSTDGNS